VPEGGRQGNRALAAAALQPGGAASIHIRRAAGVDS